MYYITNEWHENCTKKIFNYKDLKNLLITETEEEIKTNCGDEDCKDIVINNLEVLLKIAREDYTDVNYIIKELELYGWIIYDLNEVKTTLLELASYPTNSEETQRTFNAVLKALDTLK